MHHGLTKNGRWKPLIPKDTKGNSFPSRHVFSIYIIAMAAWYVCPPLGVILCVAGVFLAAARVIGRYIL